MNASGSETAYIHDADSARQAVLDLEAAGIDRSDIHVSTHSSGGGGFLEGIKRFFSGEAEHDSYAGGTIVTVNDDRGLARPILAKYDARFEADASTSGTVTGASYGTTADTTDERTLKLREERLLVDKQTVKQGEVHLGKDVVTETQSVDVPVTREEVLVTRRPVAEGEYGGVVGEIGDGEEISVPVMREEVSVDKRTVVTGEVGLEKQRIQETETVGGTVRKERARLETDGNVGGSIDDRAR
jgi:uncharacterized protein (TIGR02271 family)